MKKIKLTQRKYAKIDDKNFNFINQWKWYFSHGYAMRDTSDGRIYMHRQINNTEGHLDTDHINRDKLDNRRCNLRSVSRSKNQFNRGKPRNNTSGFIGVTWCRRDRNWQAQIKLNQRNIILGRFNNIFDAIAIRMKANNIMGKASEIALKYR